MTTAIRNAQKGDRDALVSISIRTIRASYISFLGVEAVEGWLAGGTVEAYFDQHRPDCRVLEESGESVGFCVVRGALIDLMMIDCERNQPANAFCAARGWTSGEPFEDRSPNDGPPSPPN